MKLKHFMIMLFAACFLCGCANGDAEQTEQKQDTEMVEDNASEEWITDEEQFELWSENVLYLQSLETPLFDGLSLAEYEKDGERHPALYDDSYRIIFYDYHMEIQKLEMEYVYEIDLPWQLRDDYITCGKVSVERCDMNADSIEELVFATEFTGIGHMQCIDVLDFEEQYWLLFDYDPKELVENVSDFDVDMYDYNYEETDFRWYEDGVIYAEIFFGHNMTPFGNEETEILGTISGKFAYQSETNSFVLDKDSITVKWNE